MRPYIPCDATLMEITVHKYLTEVNVYQIDIKTFLEKQLHHSTTFGPSSQPQASSSLLNKRNQFKTSLNLQIQPLKKPSNQSVIKKDSDTLSCSKGSKFVKTWSWSNKVQKTIAQIYESKLVSVEEDGIDVKKDTNLKKSQQLDPDHTIVEQVHIEIELQNEDPHYREPGPRSIRSDFKCQSQIPVIHLGEDT